MAKRSEGATQERAAACSGFSERSGRRIEKGEGGPGHRKPRRYRTRKDPLSDVWEPELVSMLSREPGLKAITLLEYLQQKYPDRHPDSIRRTLERRVKQWRAESGPEKEVIFRQKHPPGVMGISDFTEPKDSFRITIRGKALSHILYHFRLPFSGWRYVRVIESGESFVALSSSLNDALYRLGGAPHTHRTDSLSAAYKNLTQDEAADVTSSSFLKSHYKSSKFQVKFFPSKRNGRCIDFSNSFEYPFFQFIFRCNSDMAQEGSCHL